MMANIIQRLSYFPCRWFFKIFLGLEIRGIEYAVHLQKPVLIIANHRSLCDSWLVGASLPFHSAFFPVRYIGGSKFSPPLNIFYSIGIISFIYRIFGALVLPREGAFEEKIKPIIALIEKGETVLMFPEGRRHHHDGIGEFKKGAAEIALRTGVFVLPVAHRTIADTGRKKTILTFGEPFRPLAQDSAAATTAFYDKITRLYQDCVCNGDDCDK